MTIGILEVSFFIPDSSSLKDKRMVLSSLKDKLRSHFNISLIEMSAQDKWQRSTLGVANIGLNKSAVNSTLSKMINFLERNPRIQIIDHQIQIL